MKSLPARPSLESLRKQAKKLARDRSLSLRDAQLAIAREYGFDGWRDLTAQVSKRLGNGLEWAAEVARRVIHDNDHERLKQLLAEYPALLSWQGNATENDIDGSLLGMATGAYADSFDPERERVFTRGAIAELLIDAGAVVTPPVVRGILQSRARGLLELFRRRALLPRTLEFHATLGDIDSVRALLHESGNDRATIYEAFLVACSFQHETVASLLLDRLIALDPALGPRVDGGLGRPAFIRDFIDNRAQFSRRTTGPWPLFVMRQVMLAVDGDPAAFVDALQRESWLLGEDFVGFQEGIIARATLHGRGPIIAALLDLAPAILRREPPPPSQAIEFAMTYAKTHLIPLLTRIWPLPDDLPHNAGMGNLARVKHWFERNPRTVQRALDVALAWSVINNHLDVADLLLDHGADINTRWGSHEPASILHELVGQVGTGENPPNYESMKFLIDRGIDLTIKDYRWNATARGWAIYAAKDEKMAKWLEEAERQPKDAGPAS